MGDSHSGVRVGSRRSSFGAIRIRSGFGGFSYRQLFWITGFLAFFISPVADNLTTALLMGAVVLAVPKGTPPAPDEHASIKQGGLVICGLFLATIITAVTFEQILHLPPFLGMMFGLSYLFFFAYYLNRQEQIKGDTITEFNIFTNVARAEWDTLLFFFGVIFCVGGLGTIGYLANVSHYLYDGWRRR